MNRRGFLRAAGGLAVAAPVAAAAPQVGAILGGGWMGVDLAAGVEMEAGVVDVVGGRVAPAMAAIYAAFHRHNGAELKRARWLEIYRHHRIRVRRGREERKPARLIWLLDERRLAARGGANVLRPTVDRKGRIRNARLRRLMQLSGFPGLPWETPCSK